MVRLTRLFPFIAFASALLLAAPVLAQAPKRGGVFRVPAPTR